MTDLVPCPTCGAPKGAGCQSSGANPLAYPAARRTGVSVRWLVEEERRPGTWVDARDSTPGGNYYNLTHVEIATWYAERFASVVVPGEVRLRVARQVWREGQLVDEETRSITLHRVTRWEEKP